MHLRKVENALGQYITVDQACQETNLGRTTVRKLATEADAMRKIGRCSRIHRKKFFDYIEKKYA